MPALAIFVLAAACVTAAEPLPDAPAATAAMAPRLAPAGDPGTAAPTMAPEARRPAPEEAPLPDPVAPVPTRAAPAPRPAGGAPQAGLARDGGPARGKTIVHKGFVLQPYVGTVGCTRSVCAGNLGADPGVAVGGFLGGNVAGWFEVGLRGGWGRLRADIAPGQDILALYGIDAGALAQQVTAATGVPLSLNHAAMTVTRTTLSTADGALALRLHLVPRGRVAAYVGSGVGYQLFRGRFDTQGGPARLDFHGLQVPVEGGLAVYVVPHLAVGARFDYRLTYYLAAALDHPALAGAVPMSALEQATSTDLDKTLPHFWTVAATVRASF